MEASAKRVGVDGADDEPHERTALLSNSGVLSSLLEFVRARADVWHGPCSHVLVGSGQRGRLRRPTEAG